MNEKQRGHNSQERDMTYTTSHYTPPNLKLPPMPVRSTEMSTSEIDYANKMHAMARKMDMKAGVPRTESDYGKPYSKARAQSRTVASKKHLVNITAYLSKNPGAISRHIADAIGMGHKTIHSYMPGYIREGLIIRNSKNQYRLAEAPQ